ncbi:MAG: hypothetical protein ABI472_13850 [Ginsengibacter sp.]
MVICGSPWLPAVAAIYIGNSSERVTGPPPPEIVADNVNNIVCGAVAGSLAVDEFIFIT